MVLVAPPEPRLETKRPVWCTLVIPDVAAAGHHNDGGRLCRGGRLGTAAAAAAAGPAAPGCGRPPRHASRHWPSDTGLCIATPGLRVPMSVTGLRVSTSGLHHVTPRLRIPPSDTGLHIATPGHRASTSV